MKPRDTLLLSIYKSRKYDALWGCAVKRREACTSERSHRDTLRRKMRAVFALPFRFTIWECAFLSQLEVQCGSEPHAAADVFSRGPS